MSKRSKQFAFKIQAFANRDHEKDVAAMLKELEEEREGAEKQAGREQCEYWDLAHRISKYNFPNRFLRSLIELRFVARMRALKAKTIGVDRNANRGKEGYDEIKVFK